MKMELLALSVVSALLVMALDAPMTYGQAQGDRGFNAPGAGFGSNPFAAKPGGANPDELFEDDEFEDFDDSEIDDISDEILRQRMEQRLKERAQTQPGGGAGAGRDRRTTVDFGETSQSMGNTSTTGGANSQITPGGKSNCLKLDPFTGYGPDVVNNFDFPDADIVEIAKTLGRLTCLNFILDKDVKGRISIVSNSPITIGDAWKAFLTSMDMNGFTIIPSGKYLRIARSRDAKDKQIKTYSGDFSPDNDLYVTRVLPMKYISAEEVARVFRNFMPPNTRIIAYDQTNTLILTDTGSNIKKLVDMIQLLDVEGFDEGLEVIRVKFASAQDIAKLIDQLLPGAGGGGAPGGPPGGIPRFRAGAGFSARKTKEGGMISHVIPDDRTNSLIVSANAKGLEQVKELVNKLDSKVSETQGGSRIHVVYLQFADAEQVAQTLSNLAAGGGASRPAVAVPGQPATAQTAQLFEGAIKIAADKATNSLVITGTAADFGTISRVISKLDVPRDQVYVEAVIMELALENSSELGTNIAAPTSGIMSNQGDQFGKFLANPLSVPGLVLGFRGGSGSQSFTIPGTSNTVSVKSVQGIITALQKNSQANVLATPQILTLDNQEATIEIGENIPVPTISQVQGVGQTTGFSMQKVALKLKIKPQINKISSFVKLDIDQVLDDVSSRVLPPGVAGSALGTTTRAAKTTVVVQDGDTVAMGGLVRDQTREQVSKVPLLGDIPILGWLFSSKTKTTQKTNLLVFITPKIIKQYQQIRTVLDNKVRQRDEFVEKNMGGNDPQQDYKLEMIKSLPAVSELKSGNRVENIDYEPQEGPSRPLRSAPESQIQGRSTIQQPSVIPGPVTQPGIQPGMLPGTTGQPGQGIDSGAAPSVTPGQPPVQGTSPGVIPAPQPQQPAAPGTTMPPGGVPTTPTVPREVPTLPSPGETVGTPSG